MNLIADMWHEGSWMDKYDKDSTELPPSTDLLIYLYSKLGRPKSGWKNFKLGAAIEQNFKRTT